MHLPAPNDASERALHLAARRYCEARRQAEAAEIARCELTGLLARFGVPADAIARAVKADDAGLMRPDHLAAVRMRAETQHRSMLRFSRTGDPRYDLNRHVVLDKLLRWLDRRRAWRVEPPAATARRASRFYQRRA